MERESQQLWKLQFHKHVFKFKRFKTLFPPILLPLYLVEFILFSVDICCFKWLKDIKPKFENYVSMRILKNLPEFNETKKEEVNCNFESDFRNYLQFYDKKKPNISTEYAEFRRKLNDIADKFYEDYEIDTKKSKETTSSSDQ